jgi:hypothetical protein
VEIDSVADIKLAGRSISEDWPVDQSTRERVVETLRTILMAGDEKMAVAAARVLLAADALNIKKRIEEQKIANQEQERKRQLIEYAVKLGIVKPVDNRLGVIDSESSEG